MIIIHSRESEPSVSDSCNSEDSGSMDYFSSQSLSLGSILSPLGSPLNFSPIGMESFTSDGTISRMSYLIAHRRPRKARLDLIEETLPDMPDKIEKAEGHDLRCTAVLREAYLCPSEVKELEAPIPESVEESLRRLRDNIYREVAGDEYEKLGDETMKMSAY